MNFSSKAAPHLGTVQSSKLSAPGGRTQTLGGQDTVSDAVASPKLSGRLKIQRSLPADIAWLLLGNEMLQFTLGKLRLPWSFL